MRIEGVIFAEKSLARDNKRDLSFNLRLNAWTLGAIGTWPRSMDHSWLETIQHTSLNLLCYSLLAFVVISDGMFVILETIDFYDQLKVASASSFFVMAALKYCVLIIREDDIRRCVEYIKNDWRNAKHYEDRKIMMDNATFSRRLIVICGAFMYGGVFFYYIALPLTRGKIVEDGGNLTYVGLVYPFPKVLLDARRSPANEILYTVQLLAGFVAHNITVAACGLAALLAIHACGQLQVLTAWLEKLVDGRENEERSLDERVADAVEQHVRVINFIADTENLLREISLVEVLGCTLNICCLGYYSMTEWDVKQPVIGATYIILLTSVTFNIFIFCYIGELLAEQTIKVGEKSYMIDWHRMPGKKSLFVSLMISMSRSTGKITAGNIIDLSISSFGDVSDPQTSQTFFPISMGRIPTDDQNYTHIPLAFPFTRYILDAYRSPANEIVFSVQLVGGSLVHGITAAACSLAAALAVHACGQMKVLINWLDHMIDGRSDMSKSVDGRIASIVRQHVRILKCVHRLFLITLWFYGRIRGRCIESKLVQVAGNSSFLVHFKYSISTKHCKTQFQRK